MPRDDAEARVDFGLLADGEIARERLGNPDFGLQLAGIRHADEVRAGADLPADLHVLVELLQLAFHRRLDQEIAELADELVVTRLRLVDLGLSRRQLRFERVSRRLQLILGERDAVFGRVDRRLLLLDDELRRRSPVSAAQRWR